MSIDDLFNKDKGKGPKVLSRGAVRKLLGEMLEEQEKLTGEAIPRNEKKDYIRRCHKILRNPIRRPSPFSHRLIMPNELYLDVSKSLFCVADSSSTFEWLGTPGAQLCGALTLCAHDSGKAPTTVCLGLFSPDSAVAENIDGMLDMFDASHDITAYLVGRDTDLELAAAIAAHLKDKRIRLNADLGKHSAMAVHIVSNDMIASPMLPGPIRKIREMPLFPMFERYSNPDRPYMMHQYYDARKKDGAQTQQETSPDLQPE